jgi:tetratricopeptide (TPR) repeat protein
MNKRQRSKNSKLFRVRKSVLFACSLISLLAVTGAQVALADISQADEYLIQNRFKQAEDSYRELIESDDTGDAFAGLAVALAKQGTPAKILEAEKILKKAHDKFSDNANVMAAAGYVSFVHSKAVASPAKRDQFLGASENLCKRAIKMDPSILIAQQTLGLVRMNQDDVQGAIEPLRKSVEIAENAVNLSLLAQALLRLNPKDTEAAELADKALALKADYPQAHIDKAVVLLNQDKPEDAFLELKCVPESARNTEWFLVQGDIYKKQGDGPAGLASWKESSRLEPHNPDAYRHLAEYHTLRGDGELAISEMHDALEILPNDLPLRMQLAELALREDKLDVAESEYRTVLASQEDDPEALLGLSRVYYKKGRKEGQYPAGWQQLLDKLQTVVTEQSVRGQVVDGAKNLNENIKLNESEKALSQYKFREAHKLITPVIDSHRTEPYALLTLGEQCFNDGDFYSAERAYNYAKEIPEVAPRAEQGLSKITSQRDEAKRYTKLGDATWSLPEVAVDNYKHALIHDPEYPPAYYGLYGLYTKSKSPDVDRAIENAVRFLEAAPDSNANRKEVEQNLEKLRRRTGKEKEKEKK